MAHGGFSLSFGYSDCGRSYYRPHYYGYSRAPVIVYRAPSYCYRPWYGDRYYYRYNSWDRPWGRHHHRHHH